MQYKLVQSVYLIHIHTHSSDVPLYIIGLLYPKHELELASFFHFIPFLRKESKKQKGNGWTV